MVARAVTKKITDLPLYSLNTNQGNILYNEGGVSYQYPLTNLVSKNELASNASGLGGALIGLQQGGTVQDAILYKTVEMFGAIGDGVTDDTINIQTALAWVVAAPYRNLIFSFGKKYRTTTPLTATFGGQNTLFCGITMYGVLYPDTNVGDALTISEATYCQFYLKVCGDGYNIATIPDYSAADPVGGQQAFVINSCRACKVDVVGNGFGGRVKSRVQRGLMNP